MSQHEEPQGGSVVMASVYFLLALFALGIVYVGFGYVTGGEEVQQQLFFRYGKDTINKGTAGPMMMGVGVLLAIAMGALGAYRLKKPIGAEE